MSPLSFHASLFTSDRPALFRVEVPRSRTACILGELAPLVEGGGSLFCADGGNYFDPYVFGQYTRQRGFDPGALLGRVFVSRAFTIHQIHAVVADLFPPLLERRPVPVAMVLAVDYLFWEESLSLRERRSVFGDLLDRLVELSVAGLPIVITHDPPMQGRVWTEMLRARRDIREVTWGDDPDPEFRTYPNSRRSRGCHGKNPADV